MVLRLLVSALFLLTLGACQSGGSITKVVQFDLDKRQGLAINARRLEVVDNWLMPLEPPYVEHELHTTPAETVISWAKSTLMPKGSTGEMILNISEASIKQEALPPAEGFFDSLKDNQETRLRVTISAQFLWIQPVGNAQGTAELAAKVTQTLPESATPADYLVAKENLINSAIALLDKQARDEMAKIDNLILP